MMPGFRSAFRVNGLLGAVVVLAWASAAPAYAQTASEPDLKAVFVYNFAKFTEWPADALPPGSRLVLCVNGDHGVEAALAQLVNGRSIGSHRLVVRALDDDGSGQSCHVVYVSSTARKRLAQFLDWLETFPVLTVSDASAFAHDGGVAELFVENGRMRFAINVDAAHRSQLRISSRLLSLAKIVRGDYVQ